VSDGKGFEKTSAATSSEDKLSVFISYSRKDTETAERLREILNELEFETYLDKHDILPGEPWQERLNRLIEAADAVVFLISPDSVSSPVCSWEVNESERLAKRILSVVIRDAPADAIPQRLKRLNYIFMRNSAEEAGGVAKLREALLTDIEWLREHTRIGELASEWAAHDKPAERLLRGRVLANAEMWLTSRPSTALEPTALQLTFVGESRKAELAALAQERDRLRTTRRRLAAATGLMVTIMAGLLAWINQEYLREQYQWRVEMKPSVLTQKAERELIAKPLSEFKECAVNCPTMIVIPAGKFMMGQAAPDVTNPFEKHTVPRHEVIFARPFAVSKFEVAFDEWDACSKAGACPEVDDVQMGRGRRPVVSVSWDEAKTYAAWLSKLTGRNYRLLSEAEWEYAARGKMDPAAPATIYPWGDAPLQGNAACRNCDQRWNNRGTTPVGTFKPNGFGLHDVVGNADEWVEDVWHDTYDGAPADGTARTTGANPNLRIVRGGSWQDVLQSVKHPFPRMVGTAMRWRDNFYVRQQNIGFRLARTLKSE
jgi:formylglycine-generating enzyme required for sulfatase activity